MSMIKMKRVLVGEDPAVFCPAPLPESEVVPAEPVEVDVYINPDYVIAIETDADPNKCNMHLTTGWYHIVGDMESVVNKMESWFRKRKFVEEE